MKQTLGRFLSQENRDFPVDCEMLDTLQTNLAIISILGNIVGNKAIISGCELDSRRTRRNPGYVFLKTLDFPDGEIIYWEGGTVTGGMYVKQEPIEVSAQGYVYPQAYVVRSLAPGVGVENYSWDDFFVPKTPSQLDNYDKVQDAEIAKLAAPPLGIVQMWAGRNVPAGYELCEGQQLKISEYPALYAALGTTFNSGRDYNGNQYSTTSGYFRLPDLRGRFIVGSNVLDNEYKTAGKVGGEKKHALITSEIPIHTHSVRDYYYIEAHPTGGLSGNEYVGTGVAGSGASDTDNQYLYYKTHNTNSTGGGAAHENRPPYYTLAYIMRVR